MIEVIASDDHCRSDKIPERLERERGITKCHQIMGTKY